MNKFKTFLLMTGLMALFMFIGWGLGGRAGMLTAFIFSLGLNFFTYWFSDKMVLSMYKAQPVTKKDAGWLYDTVNNLADRAGIPRPKIYIINETMPNAFATGRNPENAVVAVTTGLLDSLNKTELEGVLAHELSHIKNLDMLTGTVAASVAGAVMMLSRIGMFFGGSNDEGEGGGIGMIFMIILAPIAAILIQLMISRSMEYSADTGAAKVIGSPQGLISALKKLHAAAKKPRQTHATPETAHMLIVSPFLGGLAGLFSTHPSLEQRIKNLERG